MTNKIDRLRNKIRAVRRLKARGGKGYFSHKNKELNDNRRDELAIVREKLARRWKKLEQEAMANITRGQRELQLQAA